MSKAPFLLTLLGLFTIAACTIQASEPILVADFQEKELSILAAIPQNASGYEGEFEDKAAIMSITEELAAAYRHADSAYLAKIIAPDAVYITPFGAMITQEQLLKDLRSGDLSFTEYDLLTIYVRSFNNTIITIGNVHIAAQQGKNKINENFRFIRVFKRINGQWQVIATDLAIYKIKMQ